MTTVSPADRGRTARRAWTGAWMAALIAGAAAVPFGPALAQQDGQPSGPVQLFPSDPNQAPDVDDANPSADEAPAQPARPESTGPSVIGPSIIGSGENAVEVAPLDAPSSEAVGLIGPETGGLPVEMWAGSARSLAFAGLKALPDTIRSPTARALAVRLLSSAAPGPDAASGQPPAGDFIAARIDGLVALGALDGARAMAETADEVPPTPALNRARTDAFLAAEAVPEACADARVLSQQSEKPYWQKLLIFCQAAAGRADEARFGLDLLAEMGGGDPLFVRLADALVAGRTPDLADADPAAFGPLHAAMARTAGAAPPDAVAVEGAAPAVAALLAAKPQALDLAEAAVWRGVLDPRRLAEIYARADFKPAELDNPLSAAAELDGARARALLYQSLAIQSIAPAKAELLTAALKTAARDGIYPVAAAVFADQLMQLPPSNALTFFAETATRALYAAGQVQRAARWHELIRVRARAGDGGAAAMGAARDRLWPLGRLAGTIPLQEGAAARVAAFERTFGEGARGRAGDPMMRVYLPLLALAPEEAAVRTAVAREALSGGAGEATTGNPAAGAVMRLAAADGRVAETVLFALMHLGQRPPAEVPPTTLADVVGALASVGLESDARRLAVEAAVAAGL